VPDEPGYDCEYTDNEVSYVFPTAGTYECVPGLSGVYLGITVQTADEFTRVIEVWTLDGAEVGAFSTSIACPPVPTEDKPLSTVKSMYR
jgi:hypothetical protein